MSRVIRVRGNALIETTLLMLVMLPLVFAMAMMGNLIDLKQTSEQTARYSAWESTVHPNANPNSVSVPVVKDRFYESAEYGIRSDSTKLSQNRLWQAQQDVDQDLADEFRVRLKPEFFSIAYEHTAPSFSPSTRVGQAIGRSGQFLENISGNSWGLSTKGVMSSTIGVSINPSTWLPLGGGVCANSDDRSCISSKSAILNDSWSASDDNHAIERIRSLMPASVLQPVGDAVSVVGNLPLFGELKDLKGAFGYVDMSVLPEYESK